MPAPRGAWVEAEGPAEAWMAGRAGSGGRQAEQATHAGGQGTPSVGVQYGVVAREGLVGVTIRAQLGPVGTAGATSANESSRRDFARESGAAE